ncbi:MAG TPA: hypothetical protein VFS21_25635 [Roseiflexaceae bacterium]|nr:hypothetical protein [Roseiflexaceae bacterium]
MKKLRLFTNPVASVGMLLGGVTGALSALLMFGTASGTSEADRILALLNGLPGASITRAFFRISEAHRRAAHCWMLAAGLLALAIQCFGGLNPPFPPATTVLFIIGAGFFGDLDYTHWRRGLPFAVAAGLVGGMVTMSQLIARGSSLSPGALPIWTLCGTLIAGAVAFNVWMNFDSLGGSQREPSKD